MARLLVTRPEQDAEGTAERLRALGHEPLIAPLMAFRVLPGDALDLSDIQAVLLTSANGARAFAQRMRGRPVDLPVLAVGDATARAARDLGIADVESAGGDVDDLARLAAARLSPSGGGLLHVAGTKVAGDLAGFLAKTGFTCRREVLYDTHAAAALPENASAAIADGTAAGVLLYSPRTAALFRDLAEAAGLGGALGNLVAYCLSANVADRAGAPWRRICVARHPTENDLMEAIAGELSAGAR
jgi:uroporphyrinogen-III synthase